MASPPAPPQGEGQTCEDGGHAAGGEGGGRTLLAALHCNVSLACLKLGEWREVNPKTQNIPPPQAERAARAAAAALKTLKP